MQGEINTPLFSSPTQKLLDKSEFWLNEIQKTLSHDEKGRKLPIIENLLQEVKNLIKNFDQISDNPSKVKQ